jgi:stage V sporulation protein B
LTIPDPFFSVLVTAYNREQHVLRCVNSCLRQSFQEFEIVVVDDASTDGTGGVLAALAEPRVRVARHQRNRGISPARATAVDHARGEWLVMLDSDWELAPHSLARLSALIGELPPGVRIIRSRLQWDNGRIGPSIMPTGITDYHDRLEWTEAVSIAQADSDAGHCIHRSVFKAANYFEDRRGAMEQLWELDLARRERSLWVPEVLGLEYSDAPNSHSRDGAARVVARLLDEAPDSMWMAETLLAEHGDELARQAPHYRTQVMESAAREAFLAGHRLRGARHTWAAARAGAVSFKLVGTSMLGIIGPSALARVKARGRTMRAQQAATDRDRRDSVSDSAGPSPRPGANPGPAVGSAAEELGDRLVDPGAARNTVLQLMSNMAGVVFTGALTLFLVRALGPSGYGRYALALSIAGLLVLPTGLGLPIAVGRYLADHRSDVRQLRAILKLGLRLQVPAALIATVGLFAAAGPVAQAYGDPGLAWPLRWMALSVIGQALFGFLNYAGTSLRQSAMGLRMALVESATETSASIVLVVAGAGAAGAALGKAVAYAIATVVGAQLMRRLLGRLHRHDRTRPVVGAREVLGYAGATFIVDLGVTVIARVDILLIGAVLTSAAVGSFGAVMRIITVLGYLGTAVAAGVAPRLSFGSGSPDTRALGQGIRYLLMVQGLMLAPMIVWSKPIVELLLGSGYPRSAEIMRVLAVMAFVSAPAAVLSVSVTYLGAARRRVRIVLLTLVLGLLCTYVLLQVAGLVGAAIADDVVAFAYVCANLWVCTRLVSIDLRILALSVCRTLVGASAMALVMLMIGTDHLSPAQWVLGAAAGATAYAAALLISREVSVPELRAVTAKLWSAARPVAA